jgi:hypothetical protein
MERREFLITDKFKEILIKNMRTDRRNTLLDVQELKPTNMTLNRNSALHLLRRVSFHPTVSEVEYFTGKNVSDAVNELLGDGEDHLPENVDRLPDPTDNSKPEYLPWYNNAIQNPSTAGALSLRFELEGILRNRYRSTVDWLFQLAVNEDLKSNPSKEKLTYFLSTIWNIEFTYDTRSFNPPSLLVNNSQTLRKLRVGNYKDIAKAMTLDGAFLLYQSLQLSDKSAPNENYARELLELFTMGIGHYSEGDIKEASRILTGWRTAPYYNSRKPNGEFQTWFDPAAHDTESKQFMGNVFQAINESENNEFKVRDEEVFKLIDVIFDVRANEIADFIANKIVKFFVYANEEQIDQNLVDSVAQKLISSNFNLRDTYFALFTSEQFFHEKYVGVQFKSPFELIVGTRRILNTDFQNNLQRLAMTQMEQDLYDPPNVSGWQQYRTWISTATYPARAKVVLDIFKGKSDQELFDWARSFPNWENPDQFFRMLFDIFLPKKFISEREDYILNGEIFANGRSKSMWQNLINSNDENLASAIRNSISLLLSSPDFHLT